MKDYILGNSEKEFKRLSLQSQIFEKESLQTLRLAGIKTRMRCADIGCGTGDVTFMMAKLVGKKGSVIGIDQNSSVIELCNKKAKKERLTNVKFLVGDIYDNGLSKDSFDLVFSRFLFQHLEEPKKAVREMMKLVVPNGTVVAEENDQDTWLIYPPSSAFEKLRHAYVDLLRLAKCDELIARKLYSLFLECGLDASVGAYSICIPMRGPFKKMGILVAESLEPTILKAKLMAEKEFLQMMDELEAYARRRDGLALYATTFRVWGKK
ncbi:MAG: ubiquinone/menaquinone biosynthesis C-methylase UbiE [Candidatus Nitrosomirales archaeon]|jgi:ubiquinone/menaquinone biosynthesis C-methylase UbiE